MKSSRDVKTLILLAEPSARLHIHALWTPHCEHTHFTDGTS